MKTRDNLKSVILSISETDKALILKDTDHEYTEIELCIFNAGYVVYTMLTNSLARLEQLASEGNCTLETEEIQNILQEERNEKRN